MSDSFIKSAESVEKLLDALEARGLIDDRLMSKLRTKVTRSERPLTAKSLAKFLVEKEHITQGQATEVLGSLVRSGVDVDPAPDEETGEAEGGEEITPIISPASAVDMTVSPLRQLSADAADEDAEGSSIFEPFPSAHIDADGDRGPDVDFGLAPDSELDAQDSDRPSSVQEPVEEPEEAPAAELPPLEDMFGTPTSPAMREPARPLAEDKPLLGEPLESQSIEPAGALETKAKRRKKKKEPKSDNEWDSPLILVGGGGLALLVLGGITIAWLLNTESADEKLTSAQQALESGSYTQAISEYEEFLEDFPRHRDHGLARVRLVVAKLRKATEALNYEIAFDVAQTDLEEVENEEKFGEVAHGELAALLPRIALGLAKEAEAADDPDTAKRLVEQSTAALALSSNTKYVPKSLRYEAELGEVREMLGRIERRRQSQQDLQEAIGAMEQAIGAGDTRAAYAHHVQFVKDHPDLSGDEGLRGMLKKTTAAEQAAIRFVADEQAAETSERPTPWLASLAVANRRVRPAANATAGEGTACVRVDGAVYGLDAATGKLLWRRYVGFAQAAWPVSADDHVLVTDAQRHELMRLEAATGKLIWRQSLGEPFAQPLVIGQRGFLAAESGRLYVLDLTSGARMGYVEFAQPLRVTPAVDRGGERLYLPGDHSSLYALSLADLSCLGVYYLGHAEGSITVTPVPVLNKLAVLENDGVETSRLRLMSLEENGAVAGQVLEKRLTGLATSPPFVAGRRLIVVTDRGQIEVYEVASGDGEEALTLVATRAAAGSKPIVRHVALSGNHVWVGDTQLTKYSILPTGNRLPVVSTENTFENAVFDQPLALFGKTLIHVHRPKGRAGAVVAATKTEQGHTLWEIDLAMPPAGPPVVDNSGKTLAAASAEGYVFRFDEEAIRARVQDEPLDVPMMPARLPALAFAVDLGQGRAAFGAPGSDRLLLYDSASGGTAKWLPLASPLACRVTPWGDGLVAPLEIGQVFYLSAADGSQVGTPFQPLLQPRTTTDYQPAAATDDPRQFVIADGKEKIYLVALVDQPQPHLKAVAEATTPNPIQSPLVVSGDSAVGVAGSSHLVRFRLPSLEPAGEANLPAPATWGPYTADDGLLLATADDQLIAISPDGQIAWQVAIEHGDLAGAPLVTESSVLLAYRKGIIERRSLVDGTSQTTADVAHPLAAGPVRFLKRLVLTAGDGTLLVVDEP